jgi:malto-oligosyltrehalose synthase
VIETVRATYRIQLRGGVDFATIASAVPYIARLGISHLYLSPIWQARAGSTHGYDVVDPNVIEPALGGEAGFRDLVAEAKSAGLGIILDHVPNHMGVGSDNAWWWDVLLNGRASRFAGHFDIDWAATAGATPGRLLLPVLGASYGEVLASGDLRVEAAAGGFELRYHDQRFPLRADSVPNGQAELHALLERQAYRLAYWRLGGEALNYRRFFDIDGLVGVRVEDETVFADAHRLLLELVAEGAVQGVRLDHIDGLRDPTGYLHRLDTALREATGGAPPPVWVEKILEGGETLRPDWPVAGTTGYEAADRLARLFVAGDGMGTLDALWRQVAEGEADFAAMLRDCKALVLGASFAGELEWLVASALHLAAGDARFRDTGRASLTRALTALILAFPVYRTYLDGASPDAADQQRLAAVLSEARQRAGLADDLPFALVEHILDETTAKAAALDWAARLQQLTGPIMAKAKEDTAFYRHIRLVALNEVGGEPDHPVLAADDFHAFAAAMPPLCQLAGSTHDSKRGEDLRARLIGLSHHAEAWQEAVAGWLDTKPDSIAASDACLVWQTIAGAWPDDLEPGDAPGRKAFADRLDAYLVKALREAKARSSWTTPDEAYESAVQAFAASCLEGATGRALHDFRSRLLPEGIARSLAQTALRLAMPGIPDIYQGAELWNLGLVDPDNRHPADFTHLAAQLAEPSPDFGHDWRRGRVKQFLIQRLLADRAARPALYAEGAYVPLEVGGSAVAFARLAADDALLVAVPIRADPALPPGEAPRFGPQFAGTRVALPSALADRKWRCLLTGRETDGPLDLGELLVDWPVVVLASR